MLTEVEITSQGMLACNKIAMVEQFISEAIQPVAETIDTTRMGSGEPGLPMQFRWRSEIVRITQVLGTWRETGPCHHGSGEQYVVSTGSKC